MLPNKTVMALKSLRSGQRLEKGGTEQSKDFPVVAQLVSGRDRDRAQCCLLPPGAPWAGARCPALP